MKLRHYLAIAVVTLILNGVTIASCRVQQCNAHVPVTCEP